MPMQLTILSVFMLVVMACKPSMDSGAKSSASGGSRPTAVRRVDIQQLLDWGSITLDESGKLRGQITLPLDVIPNGGLAGSALPLCMNALAPDTEIGIVECVQGRVESKPLLVRMVLQECYTNDQVSKVSPTTNLELPGCGKADLRGFRFDPQIRVDVELGN